MATVKMLFFPFDGLQAWYLSDQRGSDRFASIIMNSSYNPGEISVTSPVIMTSLFKIRESWVNLQQGRVISYILSLRCGLRPGGSASALEKECRDGEIRTPGFCVPNAARYLAALHPDTISAVLTPGAAIFFNRFFPYLSKFNCVPVQGRRGVSFHWTGARYLCCGFI